MRIHGGKEEEESLCITIIFTFSNYIRYAVNFQVIIFGFYSKKKSNQIKFFFKNTETGSNRPISVRYGFLGQKLILLGFFDLAQLFSIWIRFFQFQAYKTEPNRSVFSKF